MTFTYKMYSVTGFYYYLLSFTTILKQVVYQPVNGVIGIYLFLCIHIIVRLSLLQYLSDVTLPLSQLAPPKFLILSFPFDRLSIFNVFFIPKYVFWCGKPKNDNHFVEKPIIKCLFCIFVLIFTHMHAYILPEKQKNITSLTLG